WPDARRVLFHCACGYALCSAAASNDPEKAGRYAQAALGALDRAIARGWRDAVALERDPDLDPVRGRPGYAALLRKLRPGAGGAAGGRGGGSASWSPPRPPPGRAPAGPARGGRPPRWRRPPPRGSGR